MLDSLSLNTLNSHNICAEFDNINSLCILLSALLRTGFMSSLIWRVNYKLNISVIVTHKITGSYHKPTEKSQILNTTSLDTLINNKPSKRFAIYSHELHFLNVYFTIYFDNYFHSTRSSYKPPTSGVITFLMILVKDTNFMRNS